MNGIGIKQMHVQPSEHNLCDFVDSVYKSNALIFVLENAIMQYNKIHANNLQYFYLE